MWVGACGRPKLPPRVWHSLWCRPMPTRAEADAGQPGAVQQVGAGVEAVGVALESAQPGGQRGERRRRPWRRKCGALGCVERLDGVGHGVHRAGDGDLPGQRHGQLDVVDHGVGQDLRRSGWSSRRRGLAEDRRDLGAGVRRRQDEVREPVREAMALPRPVVDPPPTETTASAPRAGAAQRLLVTSTGVCMTAPAKVPATAPPRSSTTRSASAACPAWRARARATRRAAPARRRLGRACPRRTRPFRSRSAAQGAHGSLSAPRGHVTWLTCPPTVGRRRGAGPARSWRPGCPKAAAALPGWKVVGASVPTIIQRRCRPDGPGRRPRARPRRVERDART